VSVVTTAIECGSPGGPTKPEFPAEGRAKLLLSREGGCASFGLSEAWVRIYRCTIYISVVILSVTKSNFEMQIEGKPLNHITSQSRELEHKLWQTALDAAGKVEIGPVCASSLRAWIAIGIQRMERQGRLAAEDLALAHANLRKFVDLLKREAVFLGKPNQIDSSTFHAARRRLRRQSSISTFTLWPFWPLNFVLTT
jgi:hypothetical protein